MSFIEAINYWLDIQEVIKCFDNDDSDTKFKIGQSVVYKKDKRKMATKVIAVNHADEELIEYVVDGWPFAIWENELEEAESKND